MKTLAIFLIEKKPHRDGGTYDFLKSIEVFLIKKEARTIILHEIIQQNETPTLVQIQNNQLTTLLDCTGITPYEIWYFDQNKQFTGKAYCINEGSGSFQIKTQAKWALFVHLSSKTFDNLKHFKCTDLLTNDKYGIVKKQFPLGYGKFPYWIVKRENSPCFTQIPVHINPVNKNLEGWIVNEVQSYKLENDDLLEQHLVYEGKSLYDVYCQKEGQNLKMALVLNQTKAYYFVDKNGPSISTSIPSGGVLLDVNAKIIAKNTEHFI